MASQNRTIVAGLFVAAGNRDEAEGHQQVDGGRAGGMQEERERREEERERPEIGRGAAEPEPPLAAPETDEKEQAAQKQGEIRFQPKPGRGFERVARAQRSRLHSASQKQSSVTRL